LPRVMKDTLSSFDLTAVVKDLQALVGGHIDKVYHPRLDQLVLSVRMPGEGKRFIIFTVGKWLYVSDKGPEAPQEPSDFAMMLRKRITNATISGIRQQGFERIAVLSLEKEEKFELILELFAEGNVILVKDGTIVQPLTSHTWKHRDVRARKPFIYPPPVPDPTTMTAHDLLRILQSSDTDLVRTVATKLNTGGRYSEEICVRAGFEKSVAARHITPEDASKLLRIIKEFRDEVLASGKGYIVTKGGVLEDVAPLKMRIHAKSETEEFASYSMAVENYVSRAPVRVKVEKREGTLELERLKRKLAQQEAAVIRLQDEAREKQVMGDFIFANYEEVARTLKAAKARITASKEIKEIPGFLSYDPRQAVLKIRLSTNLLELDIHGSVESNAQRYYEGSKRARRKLEGLLTALEVARSEIAQQERGEKRLEEHGKTKHKPTKRFWFERFRWFISSEGAIVLGGKDAKSNDMLVKKHLQPGDRYAHADIHGAPSVVVKMKEGITEKTLHEACEFAVATSRAWNAKIGSAAGYWVLPEQVSKTPQSGEFLAKGAFVIRGRRNYSDKLQIKLGVGQIEFERSRKIMCGPEGAIRARCSRFVMIIPGGTDKDGFAKKLSDLFEVPIEEIQAIMPPGGIDIVEQVGLTIS
jgi:predicted ribosome quality control (RQC) complex YloA/Tae2 family protein